MIPQVLILDEPTSGLDPNQILEIRDLITKIGREKTVMLSTHIMQEVEAVCKRAVIINKGVIVADDLTENLPRLLGKRNVVLVEFEKAPDAAVLRKIEGVESVKQLKGKQFEIHARGDEDIRNRIFSFAVENKLMVLSMQKEESSMEDVFHLLTREQQS
jgi:ABC-2 type transport system ATP-binding protein